MRLQTIISDRMAERLTLISEETGLHINELVRVAIMMTYMKVPWKEQEEENETN